ncbi:sensory neuron membrane protein 1-like isoform X1 [Trichogramma pretiosum]|uniref:sensory neuron membrane protein 1-like isoform X1 n=1 Tax=Trichogramma pretiosum TaxID=7493 RepID=UPI000C71A1CC|nr:sensory neuron membrane protein 1-like isoform X1 [Trichogramma pretiosum]
MRFAKKIRELAASLSRVCLRLLISDKLRALKKMQKFMSIVSEAVKASAAEKRRRGRTTATKGGILVVAGIVFGWVLWPMMLNFAIHRQVALRPGSKVRKIWQKFPFPLDFKIYLWNVTNPDEVTKGEKPVLNQIGPYFFEEWQEKVDIVDRKEDDTVEYSLKNKWIFVPGKSDGLDGQEELVMPHIFMLALIMAGVRERPKAMPIINKAVNSVFRNPTSLFVRVKAMDMMFNGLPIDCNVTDFAGSAVCSLLREKAEGTLQIDGPDQYRFSLLGAKNDTPSLARTRVLRGVKKLKQIGTVVEHDGKGNISKWDDEFCDTFNGTDGTVFHPKLYEDEDIVAFSPDLCRSISSKYRSKSKAKGISTNHYEASLGDPSTIPEQRCYCEAEDKCLTAGMMDLYKCVGVPLIATLPHFYLTDKQYLTMVDGLKPNPDQHKIFIDFEPFTGSPISARKRVQLNMMIFPIDKVKIIKTFPRALLPLVWIEEGIVLPNWMIRQLKLSHFAIGFMGFVKWMMILTGLVMCGFAAYLMTAADGANKATVKSANIENEKMSHSPNGKSNGIKTISAQLPVSVD